MLVAWVIKTLFWRQTHLNPNHTFRHAFPALLRKAKETPVS
jgi:hypothetical protein